MSAGELAIAERVGVTAPSHARCHRLSTPPCSSIRRSFNECVANAYLVGHYVQVAMLSGLARLQRLWVGWRALLPCVLEAALRACGRGRRRGKGSMLVGNSKQVLCMLCPRQAADVRSRSRQLSQAAQEPAASH